MCEHFMKLSLGQSVKLDAEYTNHSIRATVILTLDRDSFEARHIIKLSSHKSEATVKEYAITCPENKRKEMFDSLTNAMNPSKNKKAKVTSAAGAQDMNIQDVKSNLPNFDLQEIDNFDTIDDSLLIQLMEDHDKENTNDNANNNNNVQAPNALATKGPNAPPMSQFNTQVINNMVVPPHLQ